MNLGRRRQDHFEINVIPFIDVLLVIIIFFTVSTTFERYARININLPKADQERTETEIVKVEVDVDARGNVYVGGKALVNTQVLTIREALRDAMHDLKDPTVVISADADATHQAVVRVMDAARQIGLVKITFVTERTEDSAPAR
jgi:biopolymer transport protein ExbD